MRVLTHCDHM